MYALLQRANRPQPSSAQPQQQPRPKSCSKMLVWNAPQIEPSQASLELPSTPRAALPCFTNNLQQDQAKELSHQNCKTDSMQESGYFFWQASASSSWLRFLWATSVEKVVWAKASANATQSSTHCILET